MRIMWKHLDTGPCSDPEMAAGRRAVLDLRNAMQRSLRSGHKQAHMNFDALTVCLDAIERALERDSREG